MLRNDLAHAVLARDTALANQALASLTRGYPGDPAIAHGKLLVLVLQDAAESVAQSAARSAAGSAAQSGPQTAANAAQARAAKRRHFNDSVVAAAIELLGAPAAAPWLSPARERLARQHAGLPWDAHRSDDHAAPLWLAAGRWQEAADAIAGIASWRRIPTPLAWMLQAQYRLHGVDAAWPLLAELAWLAPQQLPELSRTLADPLLLRLLKRFDAHFDAHFEDDGASADDEPDLAWFPAWVLTDTAALAPHLAAAQPGQNRRAEQAFRALVVILGLERQGRHGQLMQHRKVLRDLHVGLYRAYMATR